MPTGSCIPANARLVTIFGAAGAGKSTLAKALAAALGEDQAARVPADYFLLPRSAGEPLDAFLARPLAWDWDLLHARLSLPVGTVTTTPDMDFEGFFRRAEQGGLPLPIRPVMIIDAMAPCPDATLTVRLDVPEPVRRQRITARDQRWGTRVQDRWAHLEATWDAVPPLTPDLVLDGTNALEDHVATILAALSRKKGTRRGDR